MSATNMQQSGPVKKTKRNAKKKVSVDAADSRAAIETKSSAIVAAIDMSGKDAPEFSLVEDLAKFLSSTPPWCGEMDLNEAFMWIYGAVWRAVSENVPLNERDGKRTLTVERQRQIAQIIVDTALAFPKAYFVYMPLPACQLAAEELAISPDISIVKHYQSDTERDASMRNKLVAALARTQSSSLNDNLTYLRIKCSGYLTSSPDSSAAASAISRAKRLLLLSDLFDTGLCTTRGIFMESNVPVVALQAGNNVTDTELVHAPPELLKALATRTLKGKNAGGLFASLGKGASDATADLKARRRLIEDDGNREFERVRTGLEWAFDSRHSANETRSLIEACIALEALIGEQSAERGLTDRLADRCSYALGKSTNERQSIAADFRKIYNLRSELVHGRTARLGAADRDILRTAQKLVTRLLVHEIRMLER